MSNSTKQTTFPRNAHFRILPETAKDRMASIRRIEINGEVVRAFIDKPADRPNAPWTVMAKTSLGTIKGQCDAVLAVNAAVLVLTGNPEAQGATV